MKPHSSEFQRGAALGVIALLLAWVASSCGYSTGLRVATTYESVGLEFFGNDSPERDLEQLLYGQISSALRDFADVPLAEPDRADVVMRGTLRSYRRRSGIRSPENVLLETGVYIEVDASLYARGTDTVVKGPARASIWVGYIVGGSEAEREARDRALRRVADELVLELFAPIQ